MARTFWITLFPLKIAPDRSILHYCCWKLNIFNNVRLSTFRCFTNTACVLIYISLVVTTSGWLAISKAPLLWSLLFMRIFTFMIFSTTLNCGSFSEKTSKKKHLCRHEKNYYYFCKSNIPVTNLIVGSRNMIKLSKNKSL